MNVPILSAYRRRVEDEAAAKALKSVTDALGSSNALEKGFLTGNAARAGAFGSQAGVMPGTSWSNQGGTSSALIARVTQNLTSNFQRAPEELELALAEQGLSWGPPFPPGRPLDPFFGVRRPARTWDYSVGENVQLSPRWSRIPFETIRGIYEAYDVAQICVRHLINDVRSLDYNWEPIPGIKSDVSGDIEQAIAFFDSPDKRQPFRAWLAEWLQDVLRYDAGTLYIRRNEAGDPLALEVVSGTTIIPLIDFYGRRPEDEDDATATTDGLFGGDVVPAYAQIIEGLPWDWLASDDILYQPWNPLPESQYGQAPLEAVLLSANTDIRFQWHFLQFFTEGTLPAGFMEAPPDQSDPNQIAHWQSVWDAVMLGDQSKLQQIRWVPSGSKFTEAKPAASKFDETFPLYLMRRTCAAFGVTPNDLGFTENVNKSAGDTQIDVQFRVGTSPLLHHVEDVINLFAKQHLKLRCRINFDDGRETEDRVAAAQAAKIDIESGVISVDERRQEIGYPVDRSRPMPRYINNTRSGPIPLIALESMAGQIDPETFGPADSQPLVSTPFSPAPGAIPPQGSPEAIAAAEHTAQGARDLVAATTGKPPVADDGTPIAPTDEPEAVTKTADNTGGPGVKGPATTINGGTDGITTRTGIAGSGLDDDDDEEPDDEVVKELLRQWRDNSRSRLRKGRSPRRFVDVDLPQSVHDEVWAKLASASSREEVDAAFADVGKPQAARAAFHHNADRIVAHYAPLIATALGAAFSARAIEEAVEAAHTTVAKAVDPGREAAADLLRLKLEHNGSLKTTLTSLYGDSMLQGAHDAAHAAGGTVVASLKGVSTQPAAGYWDKWEPGYGDAAARAADGGMRTMLDNVDQTITGLDNTTIDHIGNLIAEGLQRGDSVATVAREVREDVVSPARAETIANTEMNRATTEASVATYAENEVAQVDWLAEADACPECEANAEASPYALSEAPKPPQHPNCRCALSPADELGKSVADDLGLTTEERAGVWSASTDELTPAQLAYRETAGHNNGG